MDIRHGTLLNVYGSKATHAGFTFVAADVKLAGNGFQSDFRLGDQPREPMALVVRRAIDEQIDAAWVRARLPQVFRFAPTCSEVEKSLLDVGFVAASADHALAYPFVCTDHYGKAALMFSPEGPDQATKRSIADAFWGLLCENPEDLSDFEERVYHSGAGVWLTFGCQAGQLYCDESAE